MNLKFQVAVITIFGLIWPGLSNDNVLDLFPEFGQLKQSFENLETTTDELSTNYQNLQSAVTSLQEPKPVCQEGFLRKNYGAERTSATETFTYSPAFTHPPAVVYGLDLMDVDKGKNLRVDVEVHENNQYRLRLKLKTWGDTKLHTARIRWMACPKTI